MDFNKKEYQNFLDMDNLNDLERYFAEYKKVSKEIGKVLLNEFKQGFTATEKNGESTNEFTISDKGIEKFTYYLNVRENFFKLYASNLMKFSAPIYSSFLSTKEISEYIKQKVDEHTKCYNSDMQSFLRYDEKTNKFRFILSNIYEEKFGVFFKSDEAHKNQKIKNKFSSVDENMSLQFDDTSNIYTMREYLIDSMMQTNDGNFTEKINKEFQLIEEKINFCKGVKKFVDETSQNEHDYLNEQLQKIAQRYEMNINYAGNNQLDNYGKNNKKGSLVAMTKKGFFENLAILEEQVQGALFSFGENVKNGMKNIFINATTGVITDKENNVGLCVTSNKNYDVSQEDPIIIQLKLQRHAGSVLTHELAHAFDLKAAKATNAVFINELNTSNEEKVKTELLYSSHEYILEIAKKLNPTKVFQQTDDFLNLNQKVPEFEQLQQAKRELYNHQFFGDENLNIQDLKVNPSYEKIVKDISLEYAANMFNKILNNQHLVPLELKGLIDKNPELRISLFKTMKEGVEGSLLPHFIIAQNMKESFSFFSDKPLEIEKAGVSIINLKTLGESGENGYKENVDFANMGIVEELTKQINKLSSLTNIKLSNSNIEEVKLAISRESLNTIFSKSIGKNTLDGISPQIMPTHVINYTNKVAELSFASAIDLTKSPDYVLSTFNETVTANSFYKYMADPTEFASRYTQAFAEKSFRTNISRVSKRTEEFLSSSINIVSKAIVSLSTTFNAKFWSKESEVVEPEYSNYKTLDSKSIDDKLVVKNQLLQSNFLNAILNLSNKQKELQKVIASKENMQNLDCYVKIGNKSVSENNGFLRLEEIVKEKGLSKKDNDQLLGLNINDDTKNEVIKRIKKIEEERGNKEMLVNERSLKAPSL